MTFGGFGAKTKGFSGAAQRGITVALPTYRKPLPKIFAFTEELRKVFTTL
jgi:hypothetical protein